MAQVESVDTRNRGNITAMLFALLGFVLLVVSGLLLDSHRRTWQSRRDEADESTTANQAESGVRVFHRSEYRRRMAASGMIGLLGLLLGLRTFVPRTPIAISSYLAALILGCLILLLLAIIDGWSGVARVRREAKSQTTKRRELESEYAERRLSADRQSTVESTRDG